MMRLHKFALAITLALVACSTENSAQAPSQKAESSKPGVTAASTAEPTTEEISRYPLDMDKMRKLTTTMRILGEDAQGDATAADAVRMGNNDSVAQMIAKLEGNATTRAALRKAGWSAKDYVWTMTAFLQAGMMQGVLASTPGAKLPTGQSPKNIEFLKTHQREIDALGSGPDGSE
jgi:hypothetical protein